jgi:hypothetical protein
VIKDTFYLSLCNSMSQNSRLPPVATKYILNPLSFRFKTKVKVYYKSFLSSRLAPSACRVEALQSEGGLIPLYHFNFVMATVQFRFDTPQLAAGSFIAEKILNNIIKDRLPEGYALYKNARIIVGTVLSIHQA